MSDAKKVDITQHALVPSHKILTADETNVVLEKFNISKGQLPSILITDAVVKANGAKLGDVLQIDRKTQTGRTNYYRLVVE